MSSNLHVPVPGRHPQWPSNLGHRTKKWGNNVGGAAITSSSSSPPPPPAPRAFLAGLSAAGPADVPCVAAAWRPPRPPRTQASGCPSLGPPQARRGSMAPAMPASSLFPPPAASAHGPPAMPQQADTNDGNARTRQQRMHSGPALGRGGTTTVRVICHFLFLSLFLFLSSSFSLLNSSGSGFEPETSRCRMLFCDRGP